MTAGAKAPEIPRLVPEEPLPPYSYVSGQFPHPVSDPAGHSHGKSLPPAAAPDPLQWEQSRPFLLGVDLFNHGYYWEAHEAWESLWHACGRTGTTAEYLQALIKLAAAGVKVREGRPGGVRTHARRAAELLRRVAGQVGTGEGPYMGLDLAELWAFADEVAGRADEIKATPGKPVEVVFRLVLRPSGVSPKTP
jgi:predicted metal-dependent hydrolase